MSLCRYSEVVAGFGWWRRKGVCDYLLLWDDFGNDDKRYSVRLLATWLLSVCGVVLMLIGGFFVLWRPALLPEDARYMGSTAGEVLDAVPSLGKWLRRVFWVMGGFIVTTGILVVYVTISELRVGSFAAIAVLTVAGVASIGWMTAVNFVLRSDFRWALFTLSVLWLTGLGLAVAAP